MTETLIIIVLRVIKNYCKDKDDNCTGCIFNVKDSWHEFCMFQGDVPHEGCTPDDWQLDKLS